MSATRRARGIRRLAASHRNHADSTCKASRRLQVSTQHRCQLLSVRIQRRRRRLIHPDHAASLHAAAATPGACALRGRQAVGHQRLRRDRRRCGVDVEEVVMPQAGAPVGAQLIEPCVADGYLLAYAWQAAGWTSLRCVQSCIAVMHCTGRIVQG